MGMYGFSELILVARKRIITATMQCIQLIVRGASFGSGHAPSALSSRRSNVVIVAVSELSLIHI